MEKFNRINRLSKYNLDYDSLENSLKDLNLLALKITCPD